MQITFVSSKTMKKVVNYYLIFFIASFLLLCYLGGDLGYLTVRQFWITFNILFGIALVIGYIYVFTHPKEERKEFWIKHGLALLVFGIINIIILLFR